MQLDECKGKKLQIDRIFIRVYLMVTANYILIT
jgi:hypothetical protein